MTELLEKEIQPYRGHDRAVVDLIHQNLGYPPTPQRRLLECVFAVPERAFAAYWKHRGVPDDKQKTIRLPFASIDRVDVTYEPERDRPAVVARMGSLWDAEKGREIFYEMPWPIPAMLTYQVTFWARLLFDLDDLVLQLRMLFDKPGQGKYLTVEHPFPMDTRLVWTILGEILRLPQIESAERQRVLRTTAELRMQGWLSRPARRYGRVETAHVAINESDDLVEVGALLDEISVP